MYSDWACGRRGFVRTFLQAAEARIGGLACKNFFYSSSELEAVGAVERWGRWGRRGFGHALEACILSILSTPVSGGSRSRGGGLRRGFGHGGVGGGGGGGILPVTGDQEGR